MKNTIIAGIVAVLCTLAICITYAVKAPSKTEPVADAQYISEEEAADYIGVNMEIMQLMRKNLKFFEGAYMSYTYTTDAGTEETILVYNKDALDDVMAGLMKDSNKNALNFKYVQQAVKETEGKTEAAK